MIFSQPQVARGGEVQLSKPYETLKLERSHTTEDFWSQSPASLKPGDRRTITTTEGNPLEVTLFDARIAVKITTAQFAMYLDAAQRNKIFSEVDYLLDLEAWEEDEDSLPNIASYLAFLKWLVHTRDMSWTSLGLDNDGRLLAAWIPAEGAQMTANFGTNVRWSKKFNVDGEAQIVTGEYSLNHFCSTFGDFLSIPA